MKPANFLDSHEKFLIGVATKGGNITHLLSINNYSQVFVHWLQVYMMSDILSFLP